MTAVGTSHTDRAESSRLRWADVARGGCVLLVVAHHLITKHFDLATPERLDWVDAGWLAFTSALKPLRMPLFFTLSGFFAARAVTRPWRQVAGPRVVGPYYLYVVWLAIHAVIFGFATTLPMNRTQNLEELALDLVYASTSMWYLYALPVYFVLVKTLHRSRLLLFTVALALAGLALVVPLDEVNRVSVLQNFVYFAAGASFPDFVRRVAEADRRHLTQGLAAAYVALGGALLLMPTPRGLLILLLSLVAIPLALRGAAGLSRWRTGGNVLAWVGRRTLPIYVLHVPLIALLHRLPSPLPWAGSDAANAPAATITAMVYPAVATVVVTVGCLLTYAALTRYGLGWLFQRPGARAPVAAPDRTRTVR